MRMAFSVASALLTFATVATAQGRGVGTSSWTDGEGAVVRVEVTDTPGPGHSVTFTDATGFTSAVNGATAPGSTTARPTVQSTPIATTAGGTEYRVRTRLVCGQYMAFVESRGQGEPNWRPWRPTRSYKRPPPRFPAQAQPGPDDTGSMPDFTGPEPL